MAKKVKDYGRGTFGARFLVLRSPDGGKTWRPLKFLPAHIAVHLTVMFPDIYKIGNKYTFLPQRKKAVV